jgi:predicted PurR-regulated permease PerM
MDFQSSFKLNKITAFSTVIIMTVVIVFGLYALKAILIPLVVAILLAYVFSPIIEKLVKYKIPRSFSILILFIVLTLLIVYFGNMLLSNMNELVSDWPKLQAKLELQLNNLSDSLNLNRQDMFSALVNSLSYLSLSKVIFSSFTFLGNSLITLLFMAYLLFFVHTIPGKVDEAFGLHKAKKIRSIITNINQRIQQYLAIKTVLSILTGLSVYLVLVILQIKFAFLWGALAFFMNYIPNIGSFIAGIPPIITTFLQYGLTETLIVALVFVVIHFFWGNVIEPLVLGRKLNLSPIIILFSLLFWGWLWGIVGAIIAVPVSAIIKIVFSNFDGLRPIAVLMSDKENGETNYLSA